MKTKARVSIVALLGATMVLQGFTSATARPKPKPNHSVSYSFTHAIPAGFGADIVDVYVNGVLFFDNASPGTSKSVSVSRGPVQLSVYANGVIPGSTTTPVLSASPLYLGSGSNISFVAHLTATEKPQLTLFRNMTTEAGSKRTWLTVRHVAAAPSVTLKMNNVSTFMPLSNSMERKRSLSFGAYSVAAEYTETTTVTLGPTSVNLVKGTNTVLYIWGAKSKSNLAFLKQDIPTRKDD